MVRSGSVIVMHSTGKMYSGAFLHPNFLSSYAMSDNNNPFRRRHPVTSSNTNGMMMSRLTDISKPEPTLPVQKASGNSRSSSLSAQKSIILLDSSSSSVSSSSIPSPILLSTKQTPPSKLMQQSLRAAKAANRSYHTTASVHIIRRSEEAESASSTKEASPVIGRRKHSPKAALIAGVQKALKEAELDTQPPTPPRRSRSQKSSKRVSIQHPLETSVVHWNCVEILSDEPGSQEYAMIILNQPITHMRTFLRAWSACEYPQSRQMLT